MTEMTHSALRLVMPDFITNSLWSDAVKEFDKSVRKDLSNAPELLREIPLAAFGAMLLNPQQHFPRASQYLPVMPSEKVQEEWTGSKGPVLLELSLSFINLVVASVGGPDKLKSMRVLDFGIGWARLARLLLKYLPPQQLKGCDAWDNSLKLANESNIQSEVVKSDPLLNTLPFAEKSFELIYAFSIFTHLSERSFRNCLNGISKMMTDNGQFIFTVRSNFYWHIRNDLADKEKMMKLDSFQFTPFSDVTDFGDTSVSTAWLKDALKDAGLVVSSIEWSPVDALQVMIIAKKA